MINWSPDTVMSQLFAGTTLLHAAYLAKIAIYSRKLDLQTELHPIFQCFQYFDVASVW